MSRVVSEPSSTSASSRSVAKPATSTRRKRLTSILLCSGVSTGTSTTVAHPEARIAAAAAARPRLRLLLLAVSLVIGFPEQVVVLLDVETGGRDLQGLLEGFPGARELALLLEGDAEVVQGLRVVGVEGDRALETEARFVPQSLARDLDPERDLLVAGGGGHGPLRQEHGEERDDHQHGALRKWSWIWMLLSCRRGSA